MNWGYKIVVAFVIFAAFIGTLVGICVNQDISLVAKDYYRQEIAYQEQIDRMANHEALPEKPKVIYKRSEGKAVLAFPPQVKNRISQGSVHFFRPSDAKLDNKFAIQLDTEGQQHFDLSQYQKGLWKVKLQWASRSGEEYYDEMTIVI